jgi:hypothetical protein
VFDIVELGRIVDNLPWAKRDSWAAPVGAAVPHPGWARWQSSDADAVSVAAGFDAGRLTGQVVRIAHKGHAPLPGRAAGCPCLTPSSQSSRHLRNDISANTTTTAPIMVRALRALTWCAALSSSISR